jgi:hypothetical protein
VAGTCDLISCTCFNVDISYDPNPVASSSAEPCAFCLSVRIVSFHQKYSQSLFLMVVAVQTEKGLYLQQVVVVRFYRCALRRLSGTSVATSLSTGRGQGEGHYLVGQVLDVERMASQIQRRLAEKKRCLKELWLKLR